MRLTTLLITLLAAALLAACGPQEAPPAANSPLVGNPAAASTPGNPTVVALVNGQEIPREVFNEAFNRRLAYNTASDPGALAVQVLEDLIDQVLIAQEAAAMGLVVTAEQVDGEITMMRTAIASSEADWQAWLATNQFEGEDDLRTALHDSLLTNLVRDTLMGQLMGNVPQVRARHILVNTEQEARSLLARLQAGEDFAELAGTFSLDVTTRERGGDLGWFTHYELMDETLASAAFALQPGEIDGPIATQLGYHLIQTTELAERSIEPERLQLIMENLFTGWLRGLRAGAVIERYN